MDYDVDDAGRDKATRILVREPVDVNARKVKCSRSLITSYCEVDHRVDQHQNQHHVVHHKHQHQHQHQHHD